MVFQSCIKKCEIKEMEHAGGVRRGVASICDTSFDVNSMSGKVDLGSNSYTGIKMVFFEINF